VRYITCLRSQITLVSVGLYGALCKARNFNVIYIYIYEPTGYNRPTLCTGYHSFIYYSGSYMFRGPGSSVGIATDYGAGHSGDRILVGVRFFTHVQTSPGAHLAAWTMDTGSFPRVKRPGRGADHPPPPSVKVENEYPYSPSGPLVACYMVTFNLTYMFRHSYTILQGASCSF
jgi:hypothetical protein